LLGLLFLLYSREHGSLTFVHFLDQYNLTFPKKSLGFRV
jgi:hypothetical protein